MTAGLVFASVLCLMLALIGWPVADTDREPEKRNRVMRDSTAEAGRLVRRRTDVLSRAAPGLVVLGLVSSLGAIASAIVP